MSAREVSIIGTGCANLASVIACFGRLGVGARVVEDASDVADVRTVVLPGVGHFGAAMRTLRARGLDAAIQRRVREGRPLLAICLGMQLLCEASDESPGEPGLGVIPGRVTRFPAGVRVPQMGWNSFRALEGCELLEPSSMYFANSFRLGGEGAPAGWSCAVAEHGGRFVAAVERGAVLACQFHPELSGRAGLDLVSRWLTAAGKEAVPC